MNGAAPYHFGRLLQPFEVGPNDGAERVVLSEMLEAGTLVPGATLRVTAGGLVTTVSGSPITDIRVRLGPVTLTGTILGSRHFTGADATDTTWRVYNSNSQDDKGWWLVAEATVQPNGTDIATTGLLVVLSNNQFQFGNLPVEEEALMSFDPDVDNLLELTAEWDDVAANILTAKTCGFALEPSA